jgi:hypothetical protein
MPHALTIKRCFILAGTQLFEVEGRKGIDHFVHSALEKYIRCGEEMVLVADAVNSLKNGVS